MSLDGRTALASGESKWITSRAARADVQHWRARSGAMLTGSGTVLADDPQLTVRLADGIEVVPPLRVVLDTRGRLPRGTRIFDDAAPTLAVHAVDMVPDYGDEINAFAVPRDGDGLDLHATLSQLAQRDINEVQVEAGATLVRRVAARRPGRRIVAVHRAGAAGRQGPRRCSPGSAST